MIKRKIIIGTWKMNPLTLKEAEKIFYCGCNVKFKNKKNGGSYLSAFYIYRKIKKTF